MRVRTAKTLQQIVDYLIAEGYRVQVTRNHVEKAIMEIRGIDPRTVETWLKALVRFEYLIPTALNVYRLNPLKIPQLFELLRANGQLKIQ